MWISSLKKMSKTCHKCRLNILSRLIAMRRKEYVSIDLSGFISCCDKTIGRPSDTKTLLFAILIKFLEDIN